MHETDLHLEPNEASDLCPVFDPELLAARGWDRAFVTVLDEAPVEEAIVVLGHAADAGPGEGWDALRIAGRPTTAAGRTADAEACARQAGWVVLIGSQFGGKSGPLDPRRSWLARVRERSLADALDGGRAEIEIARLRFGLHRAVNDALAGAGVDLIELGPLAREAYIDATIARGASEAKRWAGRVTSADQPINVEGADFRADGRLLLGLRYPVSAEGHPLLVELDDVHALFDDPDAVPRVANVWVLEDLGSALEPAGVRALHGEGRDRFDAVVGDLDAAGKGASILDDHPEGGRAHSEHVRFTLPLVAGGGSLTCERIHTFGDVRRVEGVALAPDGHAHYVLDNDGRVGLRTLVLE